MKSSENQSSLQALMNRWMAGKPIVDDPQYVPDETGHVEMPLSAMRPGDYGHVLSLCPHCEVREHLLELGFTPGSEIKILRVAPLGDPMTVRVRGYQLSLRKREAEAVHMRRCPPEFAIDAELEAESGARGL